MRYLGYGVTALVAAGLAYLVIVMGLTSAAVRAGQPDAALALRPGSATALSLSAEVALAANDYAKAERQARLALAEFPRDTRALRVLGIALSLQGQGRQGSELMLRAGALGWRDNVTQMWLIRQAVAQQNYATAAQRIDAMLRRRQNVNELLKLMHQLVQIPAGRAAVAEQMIDAPWRRSFMVKTQHLAPEMIESHAALLRDLRQREGAPAREEVATFVGWLVDREQYAAARRAWIATLADDVRPLAQTVFDGDFQRDPAAEAEQPRYVFEWSLESQGSGYATVGSPPMLIGESALNAHGGGSAEARLAYQTLVLSPGAHVLAYDSVAGEGLTPDAFEWRLFCMKGNARLPLTPGGNRTVGLWRTSTARFQVPAGCGAQRLELHALGDGAADAWFDHVRVR